MNFAALFTDRLGSQSKLGELEEILSIDIHSSERANIHLLVVDDDDRIRDLLKRYLGKAGFRVSAAAHEGEARAKMNGLSFDLIILDVMMPNETGFDFTRTIRKYDDVPIILLTAKGESAARIEGLRTGADDYLAKPFEPEELVLRIDAILRRSGTEALGNLISFGPYKYDIERLVLSKGETRIRLTTGEEAL